MPTVLAVDIGGTKMATARVTEAGRLTDRQEVATPRGAGPDDLWDVLARAIAATLAGGPVVACGCGCGGPMAPGGEQVSPLNIPGWRGFPLRARLAQAAGHPAFVDNDAKALALAEGWKGAAHGVRDYIGMVVSTGVGGGIVLGGRLLDGAGGNAGHIGHVIVEPGGARCACGARGCLEAVASGPSIERRTGAPAAAAMPAVRAETGRFVGRAIADVANLLDLRLAVVGGSVALGFGAAFFDAAQAELDACAQLSFSRGARVVPAALGADGPLVGAAAVAFRALGGATA
ncbi:MAG TPA: ROK family protein [Acidimicrobiales bacterium]|nr:ROK family protein [Acidimicrobiales bacterium]